MYTTKSTTNADLYETQTSDCVEPAALGVGTDYYYVMPTVPTDEYDVVADPGELSNMYEEMQMPVLLTEAMPEAAHATATTNTAVYDVASAVSCEAQLEPSHDDAQHYYDTAKPEDADVDLYDTASNIATPGKLSVTRFSQYDLVSSGHTQEGPAYSNPLMLQNKLKQKRPHTYELEKKLRSVEGSTGTGTMATYDVAGSHSEAVYDLGDNSSENLDVTRGYLYVAAKAE